MGPLAGPSLLRGAVRQVGHFFFSGCHSCMHLDIMPFIRHMSSAECTPFLCSVRRTLPGSCTHAFLPACCCECIVPVHKAVAEP